MEKTRIITGTFVLVFAISLTVCIAMNMLNIIVPLYVTENLGRDTAIAGFISTAYTASSCLSRPVNGVLTDRIGRRRMMGIGALLFAAACVLCGAIPSIIAAFACRMLMGIGYSAASTAANSASTDIIPAQRMSEGIGYFGISQSAASALGPSAAAFAIAGMGNVGGLYLTAAVCVLALVLTLPVTYEKKAAPAVTAPAKKSGFAFERTAAKASIFQGLSLFLLSCAMCFMTLYVVSLGYSSNVAGTFFLIASLMIIAVRMGLSRFVGRVSHSVFLVPGYALLAAMLVLVSISHTAPMIYLCAVLYGLGYGCFWMTLGSEAVRRAAPNRRGAANATFYFAFDAAIGLGASFWGVLIKHLDYAPCFRLAACGYILLLIASVILFRRKEPNPQ